MITTYAQGDLVTPVRFLEQHYSGRHLLPGEVFHVLEMRQSSGRMRVRCATTGVDAWQYPADFKPVDASGYEASPRELAAVNAKHILGDDADVYDIVTLAEFLIADVRTTTLGQGDAQPAPAVATPTPVCMRPHFGVPAPVDDAGSTPFVFNSGAGSSAMVSVERFVDNSIRVVVSGKSAGLSNEDSDELTRKFRS